MKQLSLSWFLSWHRNDWHAAGVGILAINWPLWSGPTSCRAWFTDPLHLPCDMHRDTWMRVPYDPAGVKGSVLLYAWNNPNCGFLWIYSPCCSACINQTAQLRPAVADMYQKCTALPLQVSLIRPTCIYDGREMWGRCFHGHVESYSWDKSPVIINCSFTLQSNNKVARPTEYLANKLGPFAHHCLNRSLGM